MPRLIIEVARELADAHRKYDAQTHIIKYFPTPQEDKVLLLEVSDAAPTTGEILPFSFAAAPDYGVEYPSTVILLSPSEWESVLQQRLNLPQEWNLAQAQDL